MTRVSAGTSDTGMRSASSRREAAGCSRIPASAAPTAESGVTQKTVEIPVNCYQVLGITEKAEKDEIVKAAMDLKKFEVEDGYTSSVNAVRQELIMDVRDKLLFEQEYAGNSKEKVPPKCSLCIPWAWLPGALCLLQEVGEEKLVLDIGQTALQHSDAKPYVHDLLLSMALAECSIAKTSFEKNKISYGFQALARAQYLLRSRDSLGKLPLLFQIEESLEELAPACTIELLSMPYSADNAERRRGAIAALHELLRQGLNVESCCRVQDWPFFLSQVLNKLQAAEIVNILSWDSLAIIRKNKKSLESQNQRVVIDFDCFYVAMLAHVALGFSTRQTELINKGKTICECLVASEGMDLKFEEVFCSLLLGQGREPAALEKLKQLESIGSTSLQSYRLSPCKVEKDKESLSQSLEIWLKDSVLGVFPDTKDCSPSLASFYGGQKRIGSDARQRFVVPKSFPTNHGLLSINFGKSRVESLHTSSIRHLGEAVKQLAPSSLLSQQSVVKVADNHYKSTLPDKLKGNNEQNRPNVYEGWSLKRDVGGRFLFFCFAGCIVLAMCKLFGMRLGRSYKIHSMHSILNADTLPWTKRSPADLMASSDSFKKKEFWVWLHELVRELGHNIQFSKNTWKMPNKWPTGGLSSLPLVSGTASHMLQKKHMPVEEAEALVSHWQEIKAEALGPNHQVDMLPNVLTESMLTKWGDLASSAKSRSCFWRFVLLQLSILRSDVLFNDNGCEIAQIEALLEEAAELVDESQLKNPNYYSTYKIFYVLKRQDDGSWRFCASNIQDHD